MMSGCASLAGSPDRVVGVTESVNLAAHTYRMDVALRAFNEGKDDGARHGLTRQQYRDMVVRVYLNAADARYHDWRARVSDERRELGAGIDGTVVGLTGLASVARQSLLRSFAATASIMAGLRGTIDRNVYFDRALPGLLAAMDTQRLRVLTRITESLTKTPEEYPLATAFADISAYEMAPSLDQAIEDVTAQVVAQRQEAQRQYDNAVHSCISTEDLSANLTHIMRWAQAAGRTADQLRSFAGLMNLHGLDGVTSVDDLQSRIEDGLAANYCTNAALTALINNAKTQSWGTGL